MPSIIGADSQALRRPARNGGAAASARPARPLTRSSGLMDGTGRSWARAEVGVPRPGGNAAGISAGRGADDTSSPRSRAAARAALAAPWRAAARRSGVSPSSLAMAAADSRPAAAQRRLCVTQAARMVSVRPAETPWPAEAPWHLTTPHPRPLRKRAVRPAPCCSNTTRPRQAPDDGLVWKTRLSPWGPPTTGVAGGQGKKDTRVGLGSGVKKGWDTMSHL